MATDFTFSEEHDELRRTVQQFLADKSEETAVREQMETERGWDPEVWKQMAEQMGLPGLVIPEEHGGAGFGYVELLVVLEEMGAALLCSPFLSTAVLSAQTLLHAADEAAQKALLPEIAAGRATATVAWVEPDSGWGLDDVSLRARSKDDGFLLDGTKTFVLDGHTADHVLVVARTDDGLGLFQVSPDASGLTRTSLPALDLTRKLAQLDFAATPARRISPAGDASQGLARALLLTEAALAAEQVGGAQRCLDMAVDYAKTRLQFGRPIGSYQAIKHKCADMLVGVEFAKSAAYNACFGIAEGDDDLAEAVAMARAYCSEAFFHAAADNIQVHGGMGFTWEHPAHLYFKRARASAELFGDPSEQRERLAEQIGI